MVTPRDLRRDGHQRGPHGGRTLEPVPRGRAITRFLGTPLQRVLPQQTQDLRARPTPTPEARGAQANKSQPRLPRTESTVRSFVPSFIPFPRPGPDTVPGRELPWQRPVLPVTGRGWREGQTPPRPREGRLGTALASTGCGGRRAGGHAGLGGASGFLPGATASPAPGDSLCALRGLQWPSDLTGGQVCTSSHTGL